MEGKEELLIDFDSPKENGRGGYVERTPLIPSLCLPVETIQPCDPFTPVKVCPRREDELVENDNETKKEEESIPEFTNDICLEDFKEVIRKRVSTCIERALNRSVADASTRQNNQDSTLKPGNCTLNTTWQTNQNATLDFIVQTPLKTTQNIVEQSTLNTKLNYIVQTSQQNTQNNIEQSTRNTTLNFIVQTPQKITQQNILNTVEQSTQNTAPEIIPKKPALIERSFSDVALQSYDKVQTEVDFEEIQKEALKLSEYFRKMSANCGSLSDLFAIEPMWDSPITSDDENELGLPTLKLQYVKLRRNSASEVKPSSESDALKRFKNRHRTSLDSSAGLDLSTQETGPELRRTVSADALNEKPPPMEELQPVVKKAELPAVVADVNQLKLRAKKTVQERKGPLKAIVPLQKMTKTIAEKILSPLKAVCSPVKKKNTSHDNTPKGVKDSSFTSRAPVAASTPNRTPISTQNLMSRLSRRDSSLPMHPVRSASATRTSLVNKNAQTGSVGSKVGQLRRPSTAPSPGSKPPAPYRTESPASRFGNRAQSPATRPLSDIQHNPRNNSQGFVKPKRSGSAGSRDKENRIISLH